MSRQLFQYNVSNSSQACQTTIVEQVLKEINACYGTVWPLHAYNACNPLSGLEDKPFVEALQCAKESMGVELCPMLHVLGKVVFERALSLESLIDDLFRLKTGLNHDTLQLLAQAELLGTVSSPKAKKKANTIKVDDSKIYLPFSQAHSRWLDAQLCYWLSGYFDDGQAIWALPKTCHEGKPQLLATWCDLVLLEPSLPKALKNHLREIITRVIKTTQSPMATLYELVALNQLQDSEILDVFHHHVKHLPGWFGYLKYRDTVGEEEQLIEQYFCIRLTYQYVLTQADWTPESVSIPIGSFSREQRIKNGLHLLKSEVSSSQIDTYVNLVSEAILIDGILQLIEQNEQDPLIYQLHQRLQQDPVQLHSDTNPDMDTEQRLLDAVFCIDVRSEPYRRALENNGQDQVTTMGFAGFFGLPIARHTHCDDAPVPLCPILLQPSYTISNKIYGSHSQTEKARLSNISLRKQQWQLVLKNLKRNCLATFTYVEAVGVVHAWTFLRDSFLKPLCSRLWKDTKQSLSVQTEPHLEAVSKNGTVMGMPLDEQIAWAKNTLPLMGFDKELAQVVLICGHGSHSTNNPYASSLDCGACGANDGSFNAQVFCQILNDPQVRHAINQCTDDGLQDMVIPEQTMFLAARHNTTEQVVEMVLPNGLIFSDAQKEAILSVQQLLNQTNAQIKIRQVSIANNNKNHSNVVAYLPHTAQAAYDWSNTRPEWGLSNNQAFIIGDRNVLRDLDLDGRAFLHSYNWQTDINGTVLEVILTAPAIVGSWINLQYLFSTLHNNRFGSGKKYTHNVTGLLGTFQGNMSDLQMGLPYESLFHNDGTPYHTPQRLLIHVTAPVERVRNILSKHPSISNLVKYQWIGLVVFDPEREETIRLQ